MARTALLIIDMQKGVYDYADKKHKPRVLKGVKQLETAARKAGVPIIWARYVSNPRNPHPKEWAADYLPGKPGTEFIPQVSPRPGDAVIDRDGYNCFHNSKLKRVLGDIRRLVLCGVNTEQCILATAGHASDDGYEVIVARDAIGTCAPALHEPALKIIGEYLGKVASLAEAKRMMK